MISRHASSGHQAQSGVCVRVCVCGGGGICVCVCGFVCVSAGVLRGRYMCV